MADDFPDLALAIDPSDPGELQPCVVCGAQTGLRCLLCDVAVCVRHSCPNGCEAPLEPRERN